jgi:hypothetical protein
VSAVRRYPLITFFVLAYVFSWWPWPLYAFGLSPGAIIGFGPFLAALVVLALTHGKVGIVGLLRRMVRWRVRPVWYAVALLLPVGVPLAATVLNVVLGAQAPSSTELEAWPGLIPTYFLLLLVPASFHLLVDHYVDEQHQGLPRRRSLPRERPEVPSGASSGRPSAAWAALSSARSSP